MIDKQMSNEIQVFIDRISKWINKKVNKYISVVIKYTEKSETNIKSELHEGTKWIHKTKQKKNVLQKYFTKNSRCYDSNLHLWQSLILHLQCSYPMNYAIH